VRLRRLATLAGSAAVHVVAAGAVLVLAAGLRQPQPLFIDLTGGSLTGGAQGGEAQAMSSSGARSGDGRRPSAAASGAPAPARRLLSRVPSPIAPPPAPIAAPEPDARAMAEPPPRPAPDAAAVDSPPRAMSPPAASDDVKVGAGEASTPGGAVTSGAPARAGQSGGGASAAPLASAGPGPDRGEAPAEFGPYLARFRRLIQEHVVYPLAARRQGMSGRVELEVLLDPAGRVRAVTLVTSSAHGLLDEAAIEAVRRVPSVPMPEHLPRRTLRVRLPVIFELQ